MAKYPTSIKTICDNCGNFIETKTDFLIATNDKVAYQGCICPKCGGILIFDNLIVRLAVPPKKSRTHKGKKPKNKKKTWKIINKGKLIIKDENTTRQPPKSRKVT